nr:hypothetical protein [Propionibacterium sp.]
MTHPRCSKAAIAFTCAVALSVLAAGNASASPSESASPAAKAHDSSPYREQTLDATKLPAHVREQLREKKLNEVTLKVEHRGGYTLVSDTDAWTVYRTEKSAAGELQAAWSAGVCSGYFGPIRKVNNRVEWSATNTCYSSSPNEVYEHTLRSTLRESGGVFDWFQLDVETAYAPYRPYSQSLTAVDSNYCEWGYSNQFDQVVNIRVHSVDFGPKVSEATTLACEASVDASN